MEMMMEDLRSLQITMPDGSTWAVPVMIIARNRAANYADEFDDDVERSLAEVVDQPPMKARDFQEGWLNGKKRVVAPVSP